MTALPLPVMMMTMMMTDDEAVMMMMMMMMVGWVRVGTVVLEMGSRF